MTALVRWFVMTACQEFNETLLSAIDATFQSLGESCRRAIYFYLETTFRVEREKIPDKIAEFDDAIRAIFKEGAVLLERSILNKLCEKLDIKPENESTMDFAKTVLQIRTVFLERESFLLIPDTETEINVTDR